jgi:SOS-response transcriptional repressor LexA
MSWQATAWAEKQVTGSPARKVLLLVLANYADEDGICWPSQETLAKGTEQSLDTIQRQLKKLEQKELITVAARPQGRGRWPGRTYKLNMPVAEKTEPQTAAQSRVNDATTEAQPAGDRAATSTDHRAATGTATEPQALRHEPSIEPPLRTFKEPSAPKQRKRSAAERQQAWQRKRGSIEVVQNRIAQRLGPDGWLILQNISERDLQMLTKMQEVGRLSDAKLEEFRLLWKNHRRGAAA